MVEDWIKITKQLYKFCGLQIITSFRGSKYSVKIVDSKGQILLLYGLIIDGSKREMFEDFIDQFFKELYCNLAASKIGNIIC